MNIFDFHKTIITTSADYLKKLALFNPLTINKKGARSKALFALALVCFLWGTTWIASKEGVKHIPDALQMAAIRRPNGSIERQQRWRFLNVGYCAVRIRG